MMNHMLQRWGLCAISLVMLSATQFASSKCKKFGSLVVRCALNARCLNVTNNVTIGGNLTVSGTVTTNTGAIGDLLAYGTWINTATVGADNIIVSGDNATFPTVVGTPSNVSIDPSNTIFTINLAGTYLISYQVIGTPDDTTSLTLQHTPFGGVIGNVTGGTMDFPVNDDIASEISNVVLVSGVGVGDTFNLNNSGGNNITLFDTIIPPAANGAAITFIRIHA
jgi:hypothetical protein